MKTILVTGVNGFIGKHLVLELVKNYYVIGLVYSKKNSLKHKNLKIIKCDITNKKELEKVFKKNKIEYVIHLAGKTINRKNIDVAKTMNVNVEGTMNIAKIGFENNVKGIVFTSTGKIYGKTNSKIINEKTKPNPTGAYPLSKTIAEIMLKTYSKQKNKTCVCLRLANVYGPNDENFERIIPATIQKIIKNKNPIIHGNGKQKRNFVYINDVVGALKSSLKLIQRKKIVEAINISSGETFSLNEIVKELLKISGKKIKINYTNGNNFSESVFSISKAKKMNWKPKTLIKKGLKNTFESYFNQ